MSFALIPMLIMAWNADRLADAQVRDLMQRWRQPE